MTLTDNFSTLLILLKSLTILIPLLLAVAYFTLAERKILGAIQRRRGPNVVGLFGLLQPLSDGFKLLIKEVILPSSANKGLFLFAPVLTFFLSLIGWAVIPFNSVAILSDLNTSILYILAVSSLGVYGIILSGWASNSKYSFLGALRSAAQMVSYEISIGFILITICLTVGSFNFQDVIKNQQNCWNIITFYPLFLIFFSAGLAETNRHPFDLPEAEAELVSGYNVEYSAMTFALFSLGEYSNMLLMSFLISIFFLGGWTGSEMIFLQTFFLSLKVLFCVIVFIWMRAALPRYRYDQLMNLGWKSFLPLTLGYTLLVIYVLLTFNQLPF
jgi:NADH-quinone oxidoreductase subunit H